MSIVQNLKYSCKDKYLLAERYYAILSAANDLKLTQRELQLIAYTAIHGNMSYGSYREEFCKKYNTTAPTINNIISKLKRMGILVKEKGKIKVLPLLILKFEENLQLNIKLING